MITTKKAIPMPEGMEHTLKNMGFARVIPKDNDVFDPYFDQMNDHWTCALSFLCMVAYEDFIVSWYKKTGSMLTILEWDGSEGELVALPFIGRYEQSAVDTAYQEIKKVFDTLQMPYVIMEISEWMMPYFNALPDAPWKEIRDRDYADYIYTREDFIYGMNKQDDRYRYRYFLRKNNHEVLELKKEHKQECMDFLHSHWCQEHTCDYCRFGCMKDCLGMAMDAFDDIHIKGLLIRVDGEAAGFCMVTVRNGMMIYQFKNAINRLKGINEVLIRECFERYGADVDLVNYTEDMGIESLREYKCRMAPYSLGYRIRLEKNS
ncbi:MAG: phosphatidylglycerol lysyltransferase domain-containing protein [Lachnospiraceae bacterium]|nr:phosphatidylglycerol lysyltransferase domain-containing protein [Lachnospiraceae bacterium]